MKSKVAADWFDRPIIHSRKSGVLYRQLLIGWIKAQRRYAKQCGYDDFAHYYSERPHVGFLAAGVWLSGGIALEEWKTEKSKKREKGYGRCDLWFSLGSRSPHHLEAKHRWLTLKGDEEQIANRLSEMMEGSLESARKLRTGSEPRLAMLSVGLISHKKNCPNEPAVLLKKALRQVEHKYCDAAAALLWKPQKIEKGKAFGTALLLRRLP